MADKDEFDKQVERLLPCMNAYWLTGCQGNAHAAQCPGYRRPIVAAALRAAGKREAMLQARLDDFQSALGDDFQDIAYPVTEGAQVHRMRDCIAELRREVADLRQYVSDVNVGAENLRADLHEALDQRDDLRREVERLQDVNQAGVELRIGMSNEIADLRRDKQQLGSALKLAHAINDDLRREVERLRISQDDSVSGRK